MANFDGAPDAGQPPGVRREPPSGPKARAWTLVAAFWLWLLLPVAIHYQRRARAEAAASGGAYEWPRSLLNRPIILWLTVLAAALALVLVLVVVGIYGDPGRS